MLNGCGRILLLRTVSHAPTTIAAALLVFCAAGPSFCKDTSAVSISLDPLPALPCRVSASVTLAASKLGVSLRWKVFCSKAGQTSGLVRLFIILTRKQTLKYEAIKRDNRNGYF